MHLVLEINIFHSPLKILQGASILISLNHMNQVANHYYKRKTEYIIWDCFINLKDGYREKEEGNKTFYL